MPYLRSMDLNKQADQILENKQKVIQFLKKKRWTAADMTSHEWLTDKYGDTCYGKMVDNKLKNCNGIRI